MFRDQLGFHFFDFRQQQFLEFTGGLKIGATLLIVTGPLLFCRIGFVGRTANDNHSPVAVVRSIHPGALGQALV